MKFRPAQDKVQVQLVPLEEKIGSIVVPSGRASSFGSVQGRPIRLGKIIQVGRKAAEDYPDLQVGMYALVDPMNLGEILDPDTRESLYFPVPRALMLLVDAEDVPERLRLPEAV